MLNVIFPLMCVPPEDEEEEEDMMESDELSANTPQTMSAQVIDNLALHLPPESLIPNLVLRSERGRGEGRRRRRREGSRE